MDRCILALAIALSAPAAFAAGASDPADTAGKASSGGRTTGIDPATARAELAELRTQMQELSRKMAQLSGELGDVGPRAYAYRYLGEPDRGMIGVVLALDGNGLRIAAVTPGGPAARAGIKNGDVIIKVRGDFEGPSSDSATFLNDALRNLKVGQEVKLTLRRDGKPLDVTVKAERRTPYNFAAAFDGDSTGPLPPDFDQRINEQVQNAMREAGHAADRARISQEQAHRVAERAAEQAQRAMQHVSQRMPWWGLNLAGLNPELGRYFGTDKGALVLSADAEALPGLRGGDVITSVGGKPVSRPEDALRALRDQPAGEDVPIGILRERKTLALSMKAPAFKSIFITPAAPVTAPLPAPAAMPAAVAAPAVPARPAKAPQADR